jgi:hypothetical protein
VTEGIAAFCQPARRRTTPGTEEGDMFQMAVQIEGGQWALTPMIPNRGAAHGVIRVAKSRWPHRHVGVDTGKPPADNAAYELCYSIAPLDDDWGDVSRLMVLTSRFLLRNDSKSQVFEVKQASTSDRLAASLNPGETLPFHWADFRLPMLVSVRPVAAKSARCQWSGGFDPLMIGAVPLKIRRADEPTDGFNNTNTEEAVSVKVECDIRSKTGGTGISLAFIDEDRWGYGALFRIENASSFPIWVSQDGLLANHDITTGQPSFLEGDLVRPNQSTVFALEVPFRQGKYAGRKAATMEELTRARVALAPLNSRHGIETTKVISMTAIGERVRLNPSKMMLFSSELRSSIRRVRVIGTVLNDGPTRVLRFG